MTLAAMKSKPFYLALYRELQMPELGRRASGGCLHEMISTGLMEEGKDFCFEQETVC